MRKSAAISTRDQRLYWQDGDDSAEFVFVDYYVESPFELEAAAVFMAEEQSLPVDIADKLPVGVATDARIAKIVSIAPLPTVSDRLLPTYWLGEFGEDQRRCLAGETFSAGEITLAFPVAGFGANLTHLWSVVYGELPRHGTLSAFRILDIRFPDEVLRQFPGPAFGVEGLRERLGVFDRPIFARSTQPPVALGTGAMAEIAAQVLRGGFDFIKDDELTLNDPLSPFEARIPHMVKRLAEVSEECNERKLFFANIIDSPLKSIERLAFAEAAGVDGVVVATGMQGIEFIREVRARCSVPILAHNAGIDMQTRHPRFGVDYALSIKLDRLCGGDLAMLPGAALTEGGDDAELRRCLDACLGALGTHKPILPILAGGKTSAELGDYCDALGTTDFMLIVASDVDNDAAGLQAGAGRYRLAWESYLQQRESAALSL